MSGNNKLAFPCIAASRGRNPDNPSDRTTGIPTRQRLEINKNGTTNTLTSVQKDNYVTEEVVNTYSSYVNNKYDEFIEKKGYFPERFNPYNCAEIEDFAPTQTSACGSTTSSATVLLKNDLRIRKLTPKECWRLMGFDDVDFEKASEVNSNTQLYKQAGNSIVVNVLEKIFKNLF